MRIVFISDTHSLHPKMTHEIPSGDVLIHAGDCTNIAKENEVRDFTEWFNSIEGFKNKIFIAGNHDLAFENSPTWLNRYIYKPLLDDHNVTYLLDESITITSPEFSRPLKIYGSPWQPEFFNWAFNLPRNGEELENKWKNIPEDTDILITHGPSFGILDYVMDSYGPRNVGCELLRIRLSVLKPLIHVFGHIHYSYGTRNVDDTLFINASICTEQYQPINKPIVVDITEVEGKFVTTLVE